MRVPCWVHIWADSTLMASVGSTDREDPNVDTQSGRFSEVALFKELSKAHKMAGRQVQVQNKSQDGKNKVANMQNINVSHMGT